VRRSRELATWSEGRRHRFLAVTLYIAAGLVLAILGLALLVYVLT
jgi:hypothetical protein